jgi:CBS domain-containing protein
MSWWERDGELCGIVTDRDIVARAIAQGLDPTVA